VTFKDRASKTVSLSPAQTSARLRRSLRKRWHPLKAAARAGVYFGIDHAVAPLVRPGETLVISGFWRSGTTWLQEALGRMLRAKTVFEPMHFKVPVMRALLEHDRLASRPEPFRELYMPYCGNGALSPPLRDLFARSLRGDVSGRLVMPLRRGLSESFRRRVLVKVVRGHLCLRAVQDAFSMPILHVYRDPRAIIASIRKTDWSWLFTHLRLREQLLDPADGRAAFFSAYEDDIRRYDAGDDVDRIAAYWALTERCLQQSYEGSTARVAFVRYEEVCGGGASRLPGILERLGLDGIAEAGDRNLDGDSFSTADSRRGASAEERIGGWRAQLSPGEVGRIEAIAERFGFGDRLRERAAVAERASP